MTTDHAIGLSVLIAFLVLVYSIVYGMLGGPRATEEEPPEKAERYPS